MRSKPFKWWISWRGRKNAQIRLHTVDLLLFLCWFLFIYSFVLVVCQTKRDQYGYTLWRQDARQREMSACVIVCVCISKSKNLYPTDICRKIEIFIKNPLLLLLGCVVVQIMRLMLISTHKMKYDGDYGNDIDDKITFYLFAKRIHCETAMNVYWFESSSSRCGSNKQCEIGNALCTHIDWGFFGRVYVCVCTMEWQAHANTYTHMRRTLNEWRQGNKLARKKESSTKNVANRC